MKRDFLTRKRQFVLKISLIVESEKFREHHSLVLVFQRKKDY